MVRLDIDTRRRQLVEAASRIALRDGLDNTTIRRVATEAGVSLGTVHYCFDSKSALLEAVVEQLVATDLDVDQFVLAPDANPVDAVRAAFHQYWDLSGAQTDRQRLVYELVAYLVRQGGSGPELAKRIFARNYELVDGFVQVFAQQWTLDFDLPEGVISRLVVAMTDGVALAWLADGDDEKALQVLDAFAGLLAERLKP